MWTYNRPASDELMHYGILGQKWGVRRFQNPDGSLTPAGKIRYGKDGGLIDNAASKMASARTKRQKKRAEKGKQLYASGQTISGNKVKQIVLGASGGVAAAVITKALSSDYGTISSASTAIASGIAFASAASMLKLEYNNKMLRAYYAR